MIVFWGHGKKNLLGSLRQEEVAEDDNRVFTAPVLGAGDFCTRSVHQSRDTFS